MSDYTLDKKWEAVSSPPAQYLRPINFGALKGKSDINPQWRIKAMTIVHGLCGIGWYHELAERWTEEGARGERMCFCRVNVHIKVGECWSAPIHGIGGNTTIDYNKNGLQSNDEGWKMAYTDALGTALKSVGVASEIFEGSWDGSKYCKKPDGVNAQPMQEKQTPPCPLVSRREAEMLTLIKESTDIDTLNALATAFNDEAKTFDNYAPFRELLVVAYRDTKSSIEGKL